MRTEEEKRRKAEYMRAYTAANRERINAQRRERREASDYLARERQWRDANKDKVRGYKATDRRRRPESYSRWKREWAARNTEKLQRKSKADYAANKDAINARSREAQRRNPERHAERCRKWAREHPDKVRECCRNSAARRRAAKKTTAVEKIDHRRIYERDAAKCGICGRPVAWKNFHLDHIVPLSRGGHHIESNVQTSHSWCNVRKGNRGPAQPRLSL